MELLWIPLRWIANAFCAVGFAIHRIVPNKRR